MHNVHNPLWNGDCNCPDPPDDIPGWEWCPECGAYLADEVPTIRGIKLEYHDLEIEPCPYCGHKEEK